MQITQLINTVGWGTIILPLELLIWMFHRGVWSPLKGFVVDRVAERPLLVGLKQPSPEVHDSCCPSCGVFQLAVLKHWVISILLIANLSTCGCKLCSRLWSVALLPLSSISNKSSNFNLPKIFSTFVTHTCVRLTWVESGHGDVSLHVMLIWGILAPLVSPVGLIWSNSLAVFHSFPLSSPLSLELLIASLVFLDVPTVAILCCFK